MIEVLAQLAVRKKNEKEAGSDVCVVCYFWDRDRG